jgi:hypothetical protein
MNGVNSGVYFPLSLPEFSIYFEKKTITLIFSIFLFFCNSKKIKKFVINDIFFGQIYHILCL